VDHLRPCVRSPRNADGPGDLLAELRAEVERLVPEMGLVRDMRLLDIIIWTSQDDPLTRPPASSPDRCLSGAIGERTTLEAVASITVLARGCYGRESQEPQVRGQPMLKPRLLMTEFGQAA
jgi:hypothetical protein